MSSPAQVGLTVPGCPRAEKVSEREVQVGDNCWESGSWSHPKASILASTSAVSFGEKKKVWVYWLFTLRNESRKPKNFQTSGSHSTKHPPRALGCSLVMLWLHLQPAEGFLPRGFSLSNSRACTAINANKALSPVCAFIQRRPGTTLRSFISGCVYNSSCSHYSRTLSAKIGLEFYFKPLFVMNWVKWLFFPYFPPYFNDGTNKNPQKSKMVFSFIHSTNTQHLPCVRFHGKHKDKSGLNTSHNRLIRENFATSSCWLQCFHMGQEREKGESPRSPVDAELDTQWT